MLTTAQKFLACAVRVSFKGAAADEADIGDLEWYVCEMTAGRFAPDQHAELMLMHAAGRFVERGATATTIACLKAGVDVVIEERMEAAEPGTPEANPDHYYQRGQYA